MPLRSDPRRLARRNHYQEGPGFLFLATQGGRPTGVDMAPDTAGIVRLREYCERLDRDPATVPIVARPGTTYAIEAATHAQHLELGVTHLIADTPIKQEDPGLKLVRAEMERVARVCGLRPR